MLKKQQVGGFQMMKPKNPFLLKKKHFVTRENQTVEQKDNEPTEPFVEDEGTESYRCTSRKVSFTESNFEAIISSGIWDKIYLGAIYKASSIEDGSFQVVDLPRNPLRIALSLVSSNSGIISTTIGNTSPTLIDRSSVYQAIVSLLNENRLVENPASGTFEFRQIFSENQLELEIGGSFQG